MSHLNHDQLIDALYGLDTSGHLDACPECLARLERMRQQSAASPAQSDAFYHRQRRAILTRMAAPAPSRAMWLPAAVAALLAVGVLVFRSSPALSPADSTSVAEEVALDPGWFDDLYSETQVYEPRALSPMRGLFAEGAITE